RAEGATVGDLLPQVMLHNIKTNLMSAIEELTHSKVTVIVYMLTADDRSRKELELLRNIQDSAPELVVLPVSVDIGSPARLLKFIKYYKFKFTFLRDPGSKTQEAFGFSATPATVIVGKDSRIIYKKVGYKKEDDMEILEMIQEAMK
ncbi:TlpA family protein disulfide reductase, partial [Thermodesulfobacteriota bacterium]